jgi:hypothetical protein
MDTAAGGHRLPAMVQVYGVVIPRNVTVYLNVCTYTHKHYPFRMTCRAATDGPPPPPPRKGIDKQHNLRQQPGWPPSFTRRCQTRRATLAEEGGGVDSPKPSRIRQEDGEEPRKASGTPFARFDRSWMALESRITYDLGEEYINNLIWVQYLSYEGRYLPD